MKNIKDCNCDCHKDNGVYLHIIDHGHGMCCNSPFRKKVKIGASGEGTDLEEHDY